MVKIIDVLLFNGESNVPCVRHSDYAALEARCAKLIEARELGAKASATLREESLAHQARCRELAGPGNATQRQLDEATKPLHVRIEELEAALVKLNNNREQPLEIADRLIAKGSGMEARVRYCECGLPLNGHTHGTRPSQSETAGKP